LTEFISNSDVLIFIIAQYDGDLFFSTLNHWCNQFIQAVGLITRLLY